LEAHLNRQQAGSTRPLLLEPAAVQREQLRISEELLRRLNVDYVDLNRRLVTIEKASGVTADQKLRAMLFWRQQENELLLQRLSEAHLHVVGQGVGMMPRAAPPVDTRVTAAMMGAGSGGDMNRVGDSANQFVSLGSNVDPLILLYQSKMVELETEIVRMGDVDTKSSVDEFYIKELANLEKDLVQWMTRAHVAEGELKVFQNALKAKDERNGRSVFFSWPHSMQSSFAGWTMLRCLICSLWPFVSRAPFLRVRVAESSSTETPFFHFRSFRKQRFLGKKGSSCR
jgi:hypothetical protein